MQYYMVFCIKKTLLDEILLFFKVACWCFNVYLLLYKT